MAVSKRLRYEILRRDNHACRYCGAAAPDVKLVVDHVIPQALGGSDESSNLATACVPCNSGKSASSPDAPVVADVDNKAVQWAAAMAVAAQERAVQREESEKVERFLYDHWEAHRPNQWRSSDLPHDWMTSVHQFLRAGLELDDLSELMLVAFDSNASNKWRYFCGCCWTRLRQAQERAAEILASSDQSTARPDMWTDEYVALYHAITKALYSKAFDSDVSEFPECKCGTVFCGNYRCKLTQSAWLMGILDAHGALGSAQSDEVKADLIANGVIESTEEDPDAVVLRR